MDELEKKIELIAKDKAIQGLIDKKVNETDNVKSAIDLLATKTALEQEETINKVVEEKQEELRNDAEAKRVQSETERLTKEVEKVKQEREKELAELDRIISIKRGEIEHLKTEADIAQAYFDSNKDILKYIGIREKKSVGVMKGLMIPASIVFVIAQILFFPITFSGILLEVLVSIIGGVCGAIKNNALKIIIAILVALLIFGVGFCVYYFTGKFIFNKEI